MRSDWFNSVGITQISVERRRQITAEGHSLNHDLIHVDGALLLAAYCYIEDVVNGNDSETVAVWPSMWPWAEEDWKPTPNDSIRQLVKAGALIAAEIDRLSSAKERGL